MRFVIHERILKPTVLSVCILAGSLLYVWFIRLDWAVGFFIFLAGLALLASCWEVWKYSNQSHFYKRKELLPVILDDHHIQFPHGYYFKFGTPHDRSKIELSRVKGFNMNTYPTSFILDDREVIFVGNIDREHIIAFCEKNGIPLLDKADIWERINRLFLDMEYEPEEVAENERVLAENGISKEALDEIRNKIKVIMWQNVFAWEWQYLGQYDYLSWIWLTKKKYWWSMEIALKNWNANR